MPTGVSTSKYELRTQEQASDVFDRQRFFFVFLCVFDLWLLLFEGGAIVFIPLPRIPREKWTATFASIRSLPTRTDLRLALHFLLGTRASSLVVVCCLIRT